MWNRCTRKCFRSKHPKGPPPDDGLEPALEQITWRGDKHISWWIWWIFCVAGSPGILNAWHLTIFVFIAYRQEHWCKIPELDGTGWSPDQIRQLSVPKSGGDFSCSAYAWNYTGLAAMASFDDALNQVTQDIDAASTPDGPPTQTCDDHYFLGSGVESEWGLVCSDTQVAMKTNIQSAVAAGKLIGAIGFGIIADRWGRRTAILISCVIYVVASMVSSFSSNYWMFLVMRVGTGMAGAGTFNVCFTVLTETCHPTQRTILGNLYNQFYPIGLFSLPIIAYLLKDQHWQYLQLALSVPTFWLLTFFCLLHESPRWLISRGRRHDAWKVVQRGSRGKIVPPPQQPAAATASEDEDDGTTCGQRLATSIRPSTNLIVNGDLRFRLFLCHFGWFATALTYYTLSLSSENFAVDRYWYIALLGLVEAVSYFVCIPILKLIGRRMCCALMFFISASTLLSMLFLPDEAMWAKFSIAMVGAFTITVVYSVIILYTSELFPTESRNTAVGTSAVWSHVAGVTSPYIVEIMGLIAWYIPSVLCGSLALAAGFLILLLPETKDKLLDDNLEQVLADEKNRVSLKNCCRFNK